MRPGQQHFIEHGCPVNQCSLTAKQEEAATADLILFDGHIWRLAFPRPPHQIWVLFMLESPYHTQGLADFNGLVSYVVAYCNCNAKWSASSQIVFLTPAVDQHVTELRCYLAPVANIRNYVQ